MTKEQIVATLANLVSYLTGVGATARKRIATKGKEDEFKGKNDKNYKSESEPLGGFWEIPDAMVEDLKAVLEAYKALKANRYPPFEIGGEKFEIGAIDFNSLTKHHEIWMVKAGLLGSSKAISTDEFLAKLTNQEVKRRVTEINTDTAGMTSIVSQKVTVDSDLPV